MFRRKKKEEKPSAEAVSEDVRPAAPAAPMADTLAQVSPGEAALESAPSAGEGAAAVSAESALATIETASPSEGVETGAAPKSAATARGHRVQKVGIVAADKMQKTVVVRVDRLVLHQKYRRYVRRTSKFMAHDDLGSTTGDRVRIVETRPLSAHKRWRVVEIVQKAAK